MRLLSAELLKMRRRTATYVVLVIPIIFMLLITSIAALSPDAVALMAQFPAAYQNAIDYGVGALGTLLAVAYAAAVAGADWNWGVLRNVIARGESRVRYILVKAGAIAIVLTIGVAIISIVSLAFGVVIGIFSRVQLGDPLSGLSLAVLRDQFVLGLLVLFERASIAFAVAVVLRNQVAGIVVGIVLFVGESIISTILTFASIAGRITSNSGLQPLPVQWFQFLPFAIGNEVRAGATSSALSPGAAGDFTSLFLQHVQLPVALGVVLIYLLVALLVSVLAIRREQIVA
jgi:ABC-type transport system involved in multi-copper enzyme maturation permease subunit